MTTTITTKITVALEITVEGTVMDGRPAMDLPQEVDDIAVLRAEIKGTNLLQGSDTILQDFFGWRITDAIGEETIVDAIWQEFSRGAQ